jgi:L-ascorbate metabolism protein UlaG (beta-lactamase superfamily)
MIIALALVLLLVIVVIFYVRLPKFGASPSGERLAAIRKSPNYKNGKFDNLRPTPQLTEGYHISGVLYEFLFKRTKGRFPIDAVPSHKTDLVNLPPERDILVWFGHSSYFIQIGGKRFLIDPVLSGNASPITGTNKSFKGTDRYEVDDLPEIDYLLITHDHYDHVDYTTIVKLVPKVKKVLCGLGVGAHFERWGYNPNIIIEKDWYDTVELDPGIVVHTTPARHFSGRGFSPKNTLWMSFVLETPDLKIYIGGDSGYDTHFAEIGTRFGPFDIAILDNGQYDRKWKYIHMLPEEVVQAAQDLRARRLFPVHSGKFVLANHPWAEPLTRVAQANNQAQNPLILMTPVIGEMVDLKNETHIFDQWWTTIN